MLDAPITPHVWLQLSAVVRNEIAKVFEMKRSTSPVCITERGVTRIESDGFTVLDLRVLNAESMQKFLGFEEIDPEADLNALLEMCAMKVTPVETIVEVITAPTVEVVPQTIVEPVVPTVEDKKFCVNCDSKGVRHKKECPSLKLEPSIKELGIA